MGRQYQPYLVLTAINRALDDLLMSLKKPSHPADRNRRCKMARSISGLSLQTVAQALGKGLSTVRNWETDGGAGPKTQVDLIQLCRLYGITTDWYLEGREPMFRNDAPLSDKLVTVIEAVARLNSQQLDALADFIETLK
ncbi:MAG: helix-turn-helix domain-containing protein [Endozoicomonas sp.]|uniref:helix-turn-helix domain-containing protein n=1 Tax=Endozoicomonas sp. TaxID=1892382 RepID=UPI003D9AE476